MSDTSNIKGIAFALELLKVFFISVEFLVFLGVVVIWYFFPAAWTFVGETLKSQEEVMKYLPVLPIALCGFSITLSWKLLSPQSGSNKELYEWPDYWKLRLLRDVTIGLCVLYAGVSIVTWIFGSTMPSSWVGAVWTWAIISALVTCGSALLAVFNLKEITEE